MKLNLFQARLIVKIKYEKLTASDLWVYFDGSYAYQYISTTLNLLAKAGLIKKEKTGRKTYYLATKEAILKAEEVLKYELGKDDRKVVDEVRTDTSPMPKLSDENDGSHTRNEKMLRLQQDV